MLRDSNGRDVKRDRIAKRVGNGRVLVRMLNDLIQHLFRGITLHIHTEPDAIGSQLLIRDLSGRVCYAQTLENENTTIPVAGWARGLYMLNVISNKGNWVYRVVLSD